MLVATSGIALNAACREGTRSDHALFMGISCNVCNCMPCGQRYRRVTYVTSRSCNGRLVDGDLVVQIHLAAPDANERLLRLLRKRRLARLIRQVGAQ